MCTGPEAMTSWSMVETGVSPDYAREQGAARVRAPVDASRSDASRIASTPSHECSMPTVHIEDVHRHEGETVTLRGWLYNRRSSGKLHFLQVRDGSGVIQAVMFKGDVDEAMFDAARRLPQESSIIVTGTVKRDERSPLGYELGIQTLEVLQEAEEYPISPKEHGVAFLMENRHLWMRSRRQHAILRIRAEIIAATRDFLDGEGYLLVDAPSSRPRRAKERRHSSRRSTSPGWPTSPSRASSTTRPRRWPSAECTASGRPSAPRSRRRVGT